MEAWGGTRTWEFKLRACGISGTQVKMLPTIAAEYAHARPSVKELLQQIEKKHNEEYADILKSKLAEVNSINHLILATDGVHSYDRQNQAMTGNHQKDEKKTKQKQTKKQSKKQETKKQNNKNKIQVTKPETKNKKPKANKPIRKRRKTKYNNKNFHVQYFLTAPEQQSNNAKEFQHGWNITHMLYVPFILYQEPNK